MKNFVSLLFLLLTIGLAAQTKLYVHENADYYVSNTDTIAILPLKVQIQLRPKEAQEITPEQMLELNKNEALEVQKGMYSWMLNRKKRGTALVEVQNPRTTNAILKKHGIDIHNYDGHLPSELGEILGVEAIITGSFETSKPLSTGAAIGLAALTGGLFATNSATLNLDILSAKDNELVVNYYKNVKGGLGSNSEDLINILMRKASRRIPYTQ